MDNSNILILWSPGIVLLYHQHVAFVCMVLEYVNYDWALFLSYVSREANSVTHFLVNYGVCQSQTLYIGMILLHN